MINSENIKDAINAKYGEHVDIFDEFFKDGFFPNTLDEYLGIYQPYVNGNKKVKESLRDNFQRLISHGYISMINLLHLFKLYVLDIGIDRPDKEEVEFILEIALEAILLHDQRNFHFSLDEKPFAALLNFLDDISRH